MGLNTLETAYANGNIIDASHINELTASLLGAFVGRDSSGAPSSGQSLGSLAIPWGTIYGDSLILDGDSLDTSLVTAPQNRIVSGAVRATSNQPLFITPDGSSAEFTLKGSSTNLNLDINGSVVSVTTDITKSGLTVGPSSSATCTVNDTTAADQAETRTWGEYGSAKDFIIVDNMGAEMLAKVGQFCIIEITGTSTEYAIAFIKSSTLLTNVYRGFFTNSSDNPVNRVAFANNDTITVLSTAWVFVEDNATTVDVTYTTPIRAFVSPDSPATGDYWYDLANNTWKRYSGASWEIIDRTLVGVVGIDSSNCVCARSFDFYDKYDFLNTVEIEKTSTEIFSIKNHSAVISVLGKTISFGTNLKQFNITTDLASAVDMYAATEQASTDYYLYLSDKGKGIYSDIEPQFRSDLLGWYHPHNTWRCVGQVYNESSSDLIAGSHVGYNSEIKKETIIVADKKASGTQGGSSVSASFQTSILNTISGDAEFATLGSNQVLLLAGKYKVRARKLIYGGDGHTSRLINITDNSTVLEGSNQFNSVANDAASNTTIDGEFTLNRTKVLELEYFCRSAQATNGLGVALTAGKDENYAEMVIDRVSDL